MESFTQAKVLLVMGMLLAGVVDDLRSKKVHNYLILAFAVIGFTYILAIEKSAGLIYLLLSLLTAFVAVLPLYLAKVLGGGDVKLFLAVSLLLPWQGVLVCLLSSLIWGALLGLFLVIAKGEFRQFFENIKTLLLRNKPRAETLHKIPYTVALFFGFLTHVSLDLSGWRLL